MSSNLQLKTQQYPEHEFTYALIKPYWEKMIKALKLKHGGSMEEI